MSKPQWSRRELLKRTVFTSAGLGLASPGKSQEAAAPAHCGGVWEMPPKQEGNNLNLIVIVADTFRADNLACYRSQWIECPNLNQFAKESVIFTDCYPEGLPTIPVRRVLYTGRRIIPCHYFPQHEPVQLPGWHPLYFEDVTLSETLQQAGYITALVCDIPHLQRPDRNFHRGFSAVHWVRGQEIDSYGTSPRHLMDVSDMASEDYFKQFPSLRRFYSQYKANRELWRQEGEALVQIVATRAIRWLEANQGERPFYLHVESFDPHEPWDPPHRFLEKYLPGATGPSFTEAPYADVKLPEEIKKRFRANYAGEVTCVDYWVGRLLDTIKELGLFENTLVVFTADHGALLGEQGQFLKGPTKLRGQVTHVPLLLRMPDKQHAGKKISGFVNHTDVMPSCLQLLGLKAPPRVTGKSFWPMMKGESKGYDQVVHAYGWIGAIRTKEWNYSQIWKAEAKQAPYKPQLYNLEKDPQELTDVADKYPDVARKLAAQLMDYVASGEGKTGGSFQGEESLDAGKVYISTPE